MIHITIFSIHHSHAFPSLHLFSSFHFHFSLVVLTNGWFENPSWLLSCQGNSGFPYLQLQIFPLFFEKVPLLPIPTLFVIPPRFKSPGGYLPWKLSNSVLPSVESPGKRYQTGHYCGHTSHKCIFVHSWQTISSLSFIHFSFIYLSISWHDPGWH